MFKDYYKILGISKHSSQQEIKVAYRKKSLEWHPDRNPSEEATLMMQDINEAYKILHDEVTRARYDVEYELFEKSQSIHQEENVTEEHPYEERNSSQCHEEEYTRDDSNSSYEYSYDIHDEKLKEDIASAREYARKLVEEFLKSLKEDTHKAAQGAWEGAKYYVLMAIIMFFLTMIVRACVQYENEQPYSKIEFIEN